MGSRKRIIRDIGFIALFKIIFNSVKQPGWFGITSKTVFGKFLEIKNILQKSSSFLSSKYVLKSIHL